MWRDMGVGMQAAVISEVDGKGPIPEHHVMFVSTRTAVEAHFLCALLNSTPVSLTVAGYTTNTGMSTHVASIIALPRFSASNPVHQTLAELSVQSHAAVAVQDNASVSPLEQQIDEQVAELFSITESELSLARDGLAAFR
jgi:hypothetical protein